VEYEDAGRSLARTALRQNGYHVLEAQHGSEALLLCEQDNALPRRVNVPEALTRWTAKANGIDGRDERPSDSDTTHVNGVSDDKAGIINELNLTSDISLRNSIGSVSKWQPAILNSMGAVDMR
jgi:CheY-like chemotaxis protein